jgi:hypothetical protein
MTLGLRIVTVSIVSAGRRASGAELSWNRIAGAPMPFHASRTPNELTA